MYKIFFKDSTIEIVEPADFIRNSSVTIIKLSDYDTSSQLAEMLLKKESQYYVIESDNPESTLHHFRALFRNVLAAGGIVYNEKNQLLMIYRRGKWDLPKGKVEEGEEVRTSAIREVEEECGVGKLRILQHFKNTYHIYSEKGTWIIKETFWFEMISKDDGPLTPQKEEGIEEAGWYEISTLREKMKNSYLSINTLLKLILEDGYLVGKI